MLGTGQRLGPYEIESLLGAGGMGEVYRARDTRLDRTVALKVLSRGLSAEPQFRERFSREARAIAAVSHPNICTLYDVGVEAGVDFLVMEYLEGETLAQHLSRGPLPIDDWLRLAAEILSALAVAHEQHVVHRDIKPGNIIITARGSIKVLDFGLSKNLAQHDSASLAMTFAATGGIVGTIDYMSPEQARGHEVDARSDIFSVGIVLFEMATGRHPFTGDDYIETLNRIAHHEPPSLPVLDSRWVEIDRIVRKCLRKSASERYASAGDVLADVRQVTRSDASTPYQPPPAVSRSRAPRLAWRRMLTISAGLALIASVAVVTWSLAHWGTRGAPFERTGQVVSSRRVIGVLGFRNLSGRDEHAWLSTALSEMLSAELGSAQSLRIVAGQNVARARKELDLTDVMTLDGETLRRLRGILGADVIILGSYLAVPASVGQLQVNLSVQDAQAGETLTTLTGKGTTESVLQIVTDLGDQLRRQFGVTATPAAAQTVRAHLVTNNAALRLYAAGIAQLRNQDYLPARDTLARAVAADPTNAQLHASLAEAWSALGYDDNARKEAEQALEYSKDLPRQDLLAVQARFHEMTEKWGAALDDYKTLFDFFPDNVDYGVSLANVQTRAGRPVDALATVARLRQLPPPAGDDARIHLAEADAAHTRSDFARELAAGKAAADRGLAQGARLLVAQGQLAQAQATLRLGNAVEARQLLDSARELFRKGGDRSGEARALNRLANVAYELGNYPEAKRQFQEAEKVSRAVGNLRDLTAILNNVADTMMMLDELDAAQPVFEDGLRIAQERRDVVGEAFLRLNLADLALRRGRLKEAETLGTHGLELARAASSAYATYMGLLALGNVMLARDDLRGAERRFQEGLDLARQANDRRYTAYLLAALAKVDLGAGRVAASRVRHQEAFQIRAALGGRAELAESQMALAEVALREESPSRSFPDLTATIRDLQSLHLSAAECYARSLQAQMLAAQGRGEEAAASARAAKMLLSTVQTVSWRYAITTALARVDAARGDRAGASDQLRRVAADARSKGFIQFVREAERALTDIRSASQRRPRA